MPGELFPVVLPIRVPPHHMVMEDLVAHLQLSPRPDYLAHPVRALLTFMQELHEDRRVRSHSLFTEETRFADFQKHLQADMRFVPCYDVLDRLDREIHVVCGRIGYTPKEVREELLPIMNTMGRMMKWLLVECQFRAHLSDTVKGWNPDWYIITEAGRAGTAGDMGADNLERSQRTVAVGRMLIADFDPALELASNLWDNVRGREEIAMETLKSHRRIVRNGGKGKSNPNQPRSKGGKPPISKSNPQLVNLYDLVLVEWWKGRPRNDIIESLQAKKDVMDLAKTLKKEINRQLIRNAKKYRDENPRT